MPTAYASAITGLFLSATCRLPVKMKTPPCGGVSRNRQKAIEETEFTRMKRMISSYGVGAAASISAPTPAAYFSKFLMNCSARSFALAS